MRSGKMTKKKKKKKRKQIFVRFAMPLGIGSGQSGKTFLIDARRMEKAINVLHELTPGKDNRLQLYKKLQELKNNKIMNWYGFILFAEILGIGPGKAYGLLGKHFKPKEFQKKRVGYLNPIMVKSLLKKIDRWGKTPKAWQDHRAYINSWCKKTGTPLFKSLSNFQDYISAWKDATVGKRKWSSSGISTKGDKVFSIFNKPPKS